MRSFTSFLITVLLALLSGCAANEAQPQELLGGPTERSTSGVVTGFRFPVGYPANAAGWRDYTRFQREFGGQFALGNSWYKIGGAAVDEPIYAVADGTVLKSNDYGGSWGNPGGVIIIKHQIQANGACVSSLYGQVVTRLVHDGDTVTKGQIVARGLNGPFGPQLHFEMRLGTVVNPGPSWGTCWPQGTLGPQYQFDATDFITNNLNMPLGVTLLQDKFNVASDDVDDTNDPWWFGAMDGYEYKPGGWGTSPGQGPLNYYFPRRWHVWNWGGSNPYSTWRRIVSAGNGYLDHGPSGNYSDNEWDVAESGRIWVPQGTAYLRFSFDEDYKVLAGDACHLDVSYNDGQNWIYDVLTPYSGSNYPNWTSRFIYLNAASSGGRYIKVRFRFTSDASGNDLGWKVDNVQLRAW